LLPLRRNMFKIRWTCARRSPGVNLSSLRPSSRTGQV